MDARYLLLLQELEDRRNWQTADSNIIVDDVSGEELEYSDISSTRND